MDARFPGQWFQLEAGLHYNWHRHYDPSIGRYTQPDPLGFIDGPSVFAYALSSPQMYVDRTGRMADEILEPVIIGGLILGAGAAAYNFCKKAIKNYTSPPPPADNDNCKPGLCCFTHESEPPDIYGGKICNYRCGADDRTTTVRMSRIDTKCMPWILDEFNQGLLGK